MGFVDGYQVSTSILGVKTLRLPENGRDEKDTVQGQHYVVQGISLPMDTISCTKSLHREKPTDNQHAFQQPPQTVTWSERLPVLTGK